jgi:hypothetical protein
MNSQWSNPSGPAPLFPIQARCDLLRSAKGPGSGRHRGRAQVPPLETWISAKYGNTAEEYLASGKRDLKDKLDILDRAGVSLEALGHILEFGCEDGQMIRCWNT